MDYLDTTQPSIVVKAFSSKGILLQFTIINENKINIYEVRRINKFLEPWILAVDTTGTKSTDEWTHWYQTFSNFLRGEESPKEEVKLNLLNNQVLMYLYACINQIRQRTRMMLRHLIFANLSLVT